jgi:hypothetical protein
VPGGGNRATVGTGRQSQTVPVGGSRQANAAWSRRIRTDPRRGARPPLTWNTTRSESCFERCDAGCSARLTWRAGVMQRIRRRLGGTDASHRSTRAQRNPRDRIRLRPTETRVTTGCELHLHPVRHREPRGRHLRTRPERQTAAGFARADTGRGDLRPA